jgi:hypothetical protein
MLDSQQLILAGRINMPDSDIPERVSDAVETIEEYTGVNVPKATAGTTVEAYRQAAIAAATALPLTFGAVGPVPVISQAQEPAKRPEEHLPSQSQAANTVGGMGFYVLAASTSDPVVLGTLVKDGMTWHVTVPSKKPKP